MSLNKRGNFFVYGDGWFGRTVCITLSKTRVILLDTKNVRHIGIVSAIARTVGGLKCFNEDGVQIEIRNRF